LTRPPVLQPPGQVEIGAVVEGAAAQQLLEGQAWMVHWPLRLSSAKAHFETVLVDGVGRIGIDFVIEQGIVVGAGQAVEAYAMDPLHRFARSHVGNLGAAIDDNEEYVAIHGDQAQGAACIHHVEGTVVAEIDLINMQELDHAACGSAIASQRRRRSIVVSILIGGGGAVAEDEGMGGCRQGDGAVRVFFDQDADGHCRRPGMSAGLGLREVYNGAGWWVRV